MLSDRGIKQAMERGDLVIEPFDYVQLGPCSYDIMPDEVYVSKKRHGLLDRRLPAGNIENVLNNSYLRCNDLFIPGYSYIGVSNIQLKSHFPVILTTRSSMARLGIEVRRIRPAHSKRSEKRIYYSIKTYGTRCEIPHGHSIAQLIIVPYGPASHEELDKLIEEGYIRKDNDRSFPPNSAHSISVVRENFKVTVLTSKRRTYEIFSRRKTPPMIMLHLHPLVKDYNGKTLRYGQNNDDCFDILDIRRRSHHELKPRKFYLMSTAEYLEMPQNYAGMLKPSSSDFLRLEIHANAPLIAPNSRGHQVFEVFPYHSRNVTAMQRVCGLEFYHLDQEPENPYTGKYFGQDCNDGPVGSRLHLESR